MFYHCLSRQMDAYYYLLTDVVLQEYESWPGIVETTKNVFLVCFSTFNNPPLNPILWIEQTMDNLQNNLYS